MHFLFVEEKIVEESLYAELLLAKDLRVDTQYYVTEQIDKEKLKTDSATARNFVLKMEEAIGNMTETQIKKIRQKLTNASPTINFTPETYGCAQKYSNSKTLRNFTLCPTHSAREILPAGAMAGWNFFQRN